MKSLRLCLLFVLGVNGVWAQQIELFVDANRHQITNDQVEALTDKATAVINSCWLSNLEIRSIGGVSSFEPDWEGESSQNHLLIDFTSPLAVSTLDGITKVNSALISLRSGNVLGRNLDAEFSLLKCSTKRFRELGCLKFLDGFVYDLPQSACPTVLAIEDPVLDNPQYLEILKGIYVKNDRDLVISDGMNLLSADDREFISSAFKLGHVSIVGSSGAWEGPKRAKAIIILQSPLQAPVEIHQPDGITALFIIDIDEVSVLPVNATLAKRKIYLTQEGEVTYSRIGETTTMFTHWAIHLQ